MQHSLYDIVYILKILCHIYILCVWWILSRDRNYVIKVEKKKSIYTRREGRKLIFGESK